MTKYMAHSFKTQLHASAFKGNEVNEAQWYLKCSTQLQAAPPSYLLDR